VVHIQHRTDRPQLIYLYQNINHNLQFGPASGMSMDFMLRRAASDAE
jgi:hypothetical protein